MLDINVDDSGSMFLFTPLTQAAREWVDAHLNLDGWQWIGYGFAVDSRFAGTIAEGMASDGLRVG